MISYGAGKLFSFPYCYLGMGKSSHPRSVFNTPSRTRAQTGTMTVISQKISIREDFLNKHVELVRKEEKCNQVKVKSCQTVQKRLKGRRKDSPNGGGKTSSQGKQGGKEKGKITVQAKREKRTKQAKR